jgi:hypothetical protein
MALPKWIQAAEKAPRGQVIQVAIAGALSVSGFFWAISMASGKCNLHDFCFF